MSSTSPKERTGSLRACRSCGAPLGARATAIVCPRCAIRQALEPEPPGTPRENEALRPLSDTEIPSGFGRYKLLEEIGSGGFGVVYAAEQIEPIRRRVAIKVVKVGMDTRQIVARFEAERQALAMMDHPNIARVFDAGATAAGRP